MKIALVSLDQVWEDKLLNQEQCSNYTRLAAEKNADLVVFPEMTLTGFTMNISLAEEPESSETHSFFRQQAVSKKISIAYGVTYKLGSKATNNLVYVNKNGEKLASYSKIHPFSYSGEDNFYTGGNKIVFATEADAIIGMTICYDLRFPEIFQALSKKCNIIMTIANWPETRVKHWSTLLEARAIENQCFMIGVNRTGADGNDLHYSGNSAIIDPSGNGLTSFFKSGALEIYEVITDMVKICRGSFPVKNDRKTDLYTSII